MELLQIATAKFIIKCDGRFLLQSATKRARDTHIDFLWFAWFAHWCKSIFFFGLFRNVKFFIAAD